MPEPRGKCTNSVICSLAQEGRILPMSGEMRCPECGAQLQPIAAVGNPWWGRVLVGAAALAIGLMGIGLGWKLSRESSVPDAPVASAAETTAGPSVKPANPLVTDEERQAVLKRIDLMPNVSSANKERLYVYVERAQRIKRVMSVSFEKGGNRLSETAIRKIVEESKKPDFASQVHDAAVVFVVLGYSDKLGDEKKNLQVSSDRAEHVADLLHKRCGVLNVIQTVPMGGSEFFNAQAAAENRVVEVWAILP